MLTKQQIRSKILFRLKIQKEDTRERKSRKISRKLFREKEFIRAKTVMFYISFNGEVNTQDMIKKARKLGKIVTVPVCKNNRVTIRPCILYNNAKFTKSPCGVSMPLLPRSIRLKDLDLVIVPGVAFDKQGNRLGRGRGCYDRFLNSMPKHIPLIGLAFDFQILPVIPAKHYDVSVHKVIFA
jgi:5-formyltetrahydrofolate cyclo-ligase